MVQQFENKRAEAGCFQNFYKFRNHTRIIDLVPDFHIKGQVKQEAQRNLEQKLVIARDKSVQFVYNVALLHFNLVFAKDTQLLQKVKYYEQEIRIVPIKHCHQL